MSRGLPEPTLPAATAEPAPLSPRQLKQIAAATFTALALYLVARWLPTGTNLNHGDFRLAEGAPGASLEFCDPSNPQFLPVVAVRSPVETRLTTPAPVTAGRPARLTLSLQTTTGKPIGEVDLLESHTRKLHVMVVDPALQDYQHLHPQPGTRPGDWLIEFTPRRAGTYRFFCDFTPAATARGLYASADLEVNPSDGVAVAAAADPAAAPAMNPGITVERAGLRFTLSSARPAVRANEAAKLVLDIRHPQGGEVPLGEVMGAFAHLVAFDETRSGFAHLHPNQTDLRERPDPVAPRLTFDVTIPESGRYVIWAQVAVAGEEIYVPFWIDVAA